MKKEIEHLNKPINKNVYRATPFWSWNSSLNKEELENQIKIFKEMGFGGFFMHPRSGLDVPYLKDDFNDCIKHCVSVAKDNNMFANLYDEDKWPSGYAGGYLTKNIQYRQKYILFTPFKQSENEFVSLLATYKIRLIGSKYVSYCKVDNNKSNVGRTFYAYKCTSSNSDEFNMQAYVDVLNKEAIDKFYEITYGNYEKIIKDEFGKVSPLIFTDEPQLKKERAICNFSLFKTVTIPWTSDLEESFIKEYNISLIDHLPELFFDSISSNYSYIRYCFHRYVGERFASSFSDNLGIKASKLGLSLTGHMMEEPTLKSQTKSIKEAMRHYKYFAIPGMDLLCGRHEYTTAKQVESVVRQENKKGMLCELYGVSRWNVELSKFKEEADWLSLLGVTIRAPHLSHYSLKKEAKRDYPPSLSYQAPFYKKFKILEDYYARLYELLDGKESINEVGIIHPIESYWISSVSNSKDNNKLDKRFLEMTEWLLYNQIDFDFISESLLPSQINNNPLCVGNCQYKTIIVPKLDTIRETTIDFLNSFIEAKGKVIVIDSLPSLIDGKKEKVILKDYELINYSKNNILSSIKENKKVFITKNDKPCFDYLANLKEGKDGPILFLTRPYKEYRYPKTSPFLNPNNKKQDKVEVEVDGLFYVTQLDLYNNIEKPLEVIHKDNKTIVSIKTYVLDSIILKYSKNKIDLIKENQKDLFNKLLIDNKASYDLSEPNCLLLDKADYIVDNKLYKGGNFSIITNKVRNKLGFEKYRNELQPWLREKCLAKKPLTLKFNIKSDIAIDKAFFALEYDEYELIVNGNCINNKAEGYYIDKDFKKIPISLMQGNNTILLKLFIGKYDRLENCYLLGNFGVKIINNKGLLTNLPNTLKFKDISKQGLPFYEGKIKYSIPFKCNYNQVKVDVNYRSFMVEASINDSHRDITISPYEAIIDCKPGNNILELVCYISPENSMGLIHSKKKRTESPKWLNYANKKNYTDKYRLEPAGLIKKPNIYE